MKHEWGGLCRAVGAIRLRDVKRFFELNVRINAKLKHPLQRHTFWRRCQTSQQNTMPTTFLVCIIHHLVTMPTEMNRAIAFSEGNSEVQVVRPTRPWNMKSGALSCCMCWPTYPKWSCTCCKFSTNLFSSSHYSVSNSHVSHWYREFHRQFWHESREPTP